MPSIRIWDVVGNMELLLDAQSTAIDTAWILTLQDVAPDGTTRGHHGWVPSGELFAGLTTRRAAPGHRCSHAGRLRRSLSDKQ